VNRSHHHLDRKGFALGIAAYGLWGILPIYFKALRAVPSVDIVAHRIVWSVPVLALLLTIAGAWGEVRTAIRNHRTLLLLAVTALLIGGNWLIYVTAIQTGQVFASSLGYYINPLMNVAAGALLFRERISREGAIAIGLAAVGVAIQTAALGHLPVISLGVALSFCLYAILRKQVKADAQTGLFIECAYLALPGLLYVLHLQSTGAGHLGASPGVTTLLLLAGPATVVPLALFAWSARRMPLSAMGFLQFIAPTLQFAVGVALGEPFTPLRALSFVFIWLGVAVFAYGAWKKTRQLSPA